MTLKWALIWISVALLCRTVLRRGRSLELRALRELLDAGILAACAVFLILRPHVVQAYHIPSESMLPTLRPGDRVLVNRVAYRVGAPRRGDIVVFERAGLGVSPGEFVKRVVGLPGETVEVTPRRLLVDGRVLLNLTRRWPAEQRELAEDRSLPVQESLAIGPAGAWAQGRRAVVRPLGQEKLSVVAISGGDRVRLTPGAVLLNDRDELGCGGQLLERSPTVAGWGAEPGLVGSVFSLNGLPRLMLVAGERMSLDRGGVRVDGRLLPEPEGWAEPDYAVGPCVVPAGHVFVLGDHRSDSEDSHSWGPLPIQAILGRADGILWPPSRVRRFATPPQ